LSKNERQKDSYSKSGNTSNNTNDLNIQQNSLSSLEGNVINSTSRDNPKKVRLPISYNSPPLPTSNVSIAIDHNFLEEIETPKFTTVIRPHFSRAKGIDPRHLLSGDTPALSTPSSQFNNEGFSSKVARISQYSNISENDQQVEEEIMNEKQSLDDTLPAEEKFQEEDLNSFSSRTMSNEHEKFPLGSFKTPNLPMINIKDEDGNLRGTLADFESEEEDNHDFEKQFSNLVLLIFNT